MSESKVEEIIAALWAICAILCAASGFTVWAWVFGIKAAFDAATSLYYAGKELKAELLVKVAAAPSAQSTGGEG